MRNIKPEIDDLDVNISVSLSRQELRKRTSDADVRRPGVDELLLGRIYAHAGGDRAMQRRLHELVTSPHGERSGQSTRRSGRRGKSDEAGGSAAS